MTNDEFVCTWAWETPQVLTGFYSMCQYLEDIGFLIVADDDGNLYLSNMPLNFN